MLALALIAPAPVPLASSKPTTDAEPANEASYWLDVRGLPPQEAEIVAAGFGDGAAETEILAAADRPEHAELLVRMSTGTLSSYESRSRQFTERGGISTDEAAAGRERTTIEVRLSVVDVLDGSTLLDSALSCELPLTRGRFVTARCLRRGFDRAIETMGEWASSTSMERGATASFGPTESDRRSLSGPDLALAYLREGIAASRAGFEGRALELLAEAQPRFREAGLRREEGAAWGHVAHLMAATQRGPERAIRYAEQTVRIARELSDPVAEARALALLAACRARSGSYADGERIARTAVAQARDQGDHAGEGAGLAILGGVAAVRGDFNAAEELYAEASGLMRESGSARAEARVRLAIATTIAQHDDRLHQASLARLEEVRELAGELDDAALWRAVTFVMADTRFTSTDLDLGLAGEVDALRAYKLADRFDDAVGRAAATGLLGTYSLRLQRPQMAFDYLLRARELSQEAGFAEGESDILQAMGEFVDDRELGVTWLAEVAGERERQDDARGRIKTLGDLSRFQTGLGRADEAWQSYRGAAAALGDYVRQLEEDPDRQDIRAGLTIILTSLIATETHLPFLARYLRLNHMIPVPDPSWFAP